MAKGSVTPIKQHVPQPSAHPAIQDDLRSVLEHQKFGEVLDEAKGKLKAALDTVEQLQQHNVQHDRHALAHLMEAFMHTIEGDERFHGHVEEGHDSGHHDHADTRRTVEQIGAGMVHLDRFLQSMEGSLTISFDQADALSYKLPGMQRYSGAIDQANHKAAAANWPEVPLGYVRGIETGRAAKVNVSDFVNMSDQELQSVSSKANPIERLQALQKVLRA